MVKLTLENVIFLWGWDIIRESLDGSVESYIACPTGYPVGCRGLRAMLSNVV